MPLYVCVLRVCHSTFGYLVYATLRLDTSFMPLYVLIPRLCHSSFEYLVYATVRLNTSFMPLYVCVPRLCHSTFVFLVYATLRLDISRHYFVIFFNQDFTQESVNTDSDRRNHDDSIVT